MDPRPTAQQSMVAAVGHHGFWGHSSSFDFLEAMDSTGSLETSDEPIRILLVHPGDVRHMITTIARRRRHSSTKSNGLERKYRPIHFYLMETPVEVISRELLLLEILFDFEVPIRQRAGAFLEVFGNALVQERTSRYIERLGYEMRNLIVDGTGRLEDIVDLSCLKYRTRDDLDRCFQSYAQAVPFDMSELRDHRLRGWYAERYDVRKQLADMDYHGGLRDTASIIHIKQFKEWRVSGIAYELGDHVYTEPNRTLMTYAEGVMKRGKDAGHKKEVKGYWGDIVSSPYFSFGVDVDSRIVDSTDKKALSDAVVSAHGGTGASQCHKHVEGLFEIMNKNTGTEQHRHHTVEVSMYNMFSYLWEIETNSPYKMAKAHDVYSGLGVEAGFAEDIAKQAEGEKKTRELESDLGLIEEEQEGEEEEEEEKEKGRGQGGMPPPPPTMADGVEKEEKDGNSLDGQNVDELAKEIQRAECIVEGISGIKVLPMVGTPDSILYKHLESGKYRHHFDAAFVSCRAAGCLDQADFASCLKPDGKALLAVETAKFMVALNRAQKQEFDDKVLEMVIGQGKFTRAKGAKGERSPNTGGGVVPRRRRDEKDSKDDVVFFVSSACESGGEN
jgi:dynein assembly factor 3